jgi:hypothetical protein
MPRGRPRIRTDEERVETHRNANNTWAARNRQYTRDQAKRYYEANKAAISARRKARYQQKKAERLAAAIN